ncbi:MAG: hypothetical protein RL701_2269 [Pseudomonadota bacterium]|jgi:hypothetical protein
MRNARPSIGRAALADLARTPDLAHRWVWVGTHSAAHLRGFNRRQALRVGLACHGVYRVFAIDAALPPVPLKRLTRLTDCGDADLLVGPALILHANPAWWAVQTAIADARTRANHRAVVPARRTGPAHAPSLFRHSGLSGSHSSLLGSNTWSAHGSLFTQRPLPSHSLSVLFPQAAPRALFCDPHAAILGVARLQ